MFQQILEQLALGLESCSIPYMIIGGQAVLLYGEPRLTRDIDLTLGAGPERLPEVLRLIESWKWQILASEPVDFVQRTMVLPCLESASGIRIDFVFSFSLYERQAIERGRLVDLGKAHVRFVSPEDLIIHKMIASRPRDLEDVRGMILKNPALDLTYIRFWLEQFDQSLQQTFLERFEQLRTSLPGT